MMTRPLFKCALAVLSMLAAACAPLQPPDRDSESAGPGGELNATAVHGELPAELRMLRDEGLALRGERVIFDGELEFPPRLKGVPTTTSVRPEIKAAARPSRQEARQSMRAAAVADARVRAALGERFSLLGGGWLEPEKKDDASVLAAERYQLRFYNYANNEVVTVITSAQREVIDVKSAPARVQPAESREEVDAAVDIVRRDERYGPLVKDLRGRGILTPGDGKDRFLYLLFYREPRTPALVEATVNMSAGRVVSARDLRTQSR